MIAFLSILVIFYLSQNNIISLFIALEILLLVVTLNIIHIGGVYDDILGTILPMFVIILAGAESAIGLSLLVSYYKLRGNVTSIL